MAKRRYFKAKQVGGYSTNRREEITEVGREDANLVSSLTDDGLHMPVIDLDLPAKLVPSRTPGHYHLFLDKEVSWTKYQRLLKAFLAAELIGQDFYDLALKHKQTFARVGETDPVVLQECPCGAMVADMEKHAEWHESQAGHYHKPTILAGG